VATRNSTVARVMASFGVILISLPASLALAGCGDPAPLPTLTITAGPTAEPSASASDEPPPATWADVPASDLPPLVAGQDPREPQAHDMQTWIWDYVDDTWSLDVVRAINNQYDPEPVQIADPFQTLFLVSPDGEYFRLFDLRTDIGIYVAHFSPSDRLGFLMRAFYEESQTVQMDLVSGAVSETWAAPGFPASDTSHAAGWFVAYKATLPDGREVWAGEGYGSPITGVFFRTPGGGVSPSAINSTLAAGVAGDGYYCMGIDAEDSTAVYDTQIYEWTTDTWTSHFIVHYLTSDTWVYTGRMGFMPTACHDDFDVTPTYWVGLGNSVAQSGLYRVYFDGSPDQPIP